MVLELVLRCWVDGRGRTRAADDDVQACPRRYGAGPLGGSREPDVSDLAAACSCRARRARLDDINEPLVNESPPRRKSWAAAAE